MIGNLSAVATEDIALHVRNADDTADDIIDCIEELAVRAGVISELNLDGDGNIDEVISKIEKILDIEL